MSVVKTFVSHHGGDYQNRVLPLLRRVAPLGVRPWRDRDEIDGGASLGDALRQGILGDACRSLCVFLTHESTKRPWVDYEVREALERARRERFAVIPIALDPVKEVKAQELPPGLDELLNLDERKWLDPAHADFAEQLARAVLGAAGVCDAGELVLHLGHRVSSADALVPEGWRELPTLDLRAELRGADDYSPSEAAWGEIEQGLRTLKAILPELRRLHVCGRAPLALGAMVGKIWDRASGVQIDAANHQSDQVWATEFADDAQMRNVTPGSVRQVRFTGPSDGSKPSLLVAFLPAGKPHYLPAVRDLKARLPGAPPLCLVETPARIADAAQAREVLVECVGLLHFLRNGFRGTIELVSGLPLALQVLLGHHLRQLGTLRLHDQVLPDGGYRLAMTIT
jgi:TIR domain